MDRVKMKVLALAYNSLSRTGAYALVLSDEEDKVRVPVIIGMAEAQAIVVQLEGVKVKRPLTHDIIKELTGRLGVDLEEVVIYRVEDGVFYAEAFFCRGEDEIIKIDIRTSDAVALALRYKCPIYMKKSVIDQVGISASTFEMKGMKSTGRHGDNLELLSDEELERLMDEAVQNEDYEQASRYRDMLKSRKEKP
ncbi:MAG: bifunctional nuclease family protein [Marinifilaceae bacterium]|nr:bifunctional nuclease family protein [Marinifilaceae bacterium]